VTKFFFVTYIYKIIKKLLQQLFTALERERERKKDESVQKFKKELVHSYIPAQAMGFRNKLRWFFQIFFTIYLFNFCNILYFSNKN